MSDATSHAPEGESNTLPPQVAQAIAQDLLRLQDVILKHEGAERLSARALGVLAYALCCPADPLTLSRLAYVFSEGRDAVASAREELVGLGLLERVEDRDGGLRRIRHQVVAR